MKALLFTTAFVLSSLLSTPGQSTSEAPIKTHQKLPKKPGRCAVWQKASWIDQLEQLKTKTDLQSLQFLTRCALQATASQVRREALSRLLQLKTEGPDTLRVIHLLESLLNRDEDLYIRYQAAHGLGDLGKTSDRATHALATSLPKSPLVMQTSIAYALGKTQKDRQIAIKALHKELKSDDPELRYTILFVLSKWGAQAAIALPQILKLTTAKDLNVRYWSIEAIGQMKEKAHTAIPALIKRLDDPHASIRTHAARALSMIGTAAAPALFKARDTSSRRARVAANSALLLLQHALKGKTCALLDKKRRPLHWTLPKHNSPTLQQLLEENENNEHKWPIISPSDRAQD